MAKETLLKKEFKQSDVQRVRNLVNKNYTEKTSIQAGYAKKYQHRTEGDIWEEEGRMWTIKNGIKQNISKVKFAKTLAKIPLTCPKCSTSMNYWLHKKMYKIHGFCFDCTVKYETSLRKAGLYDQYEKNMIKGNIKGFLNDLETWVVEQKNNQLTIVTEQGDIEDWKGSNKVLDNNLIELQKFINKSKESLVD